jgi:hypothetical protein
MLKVESCVAIGELQTAYADLPKIYELYVRIR